MDRNVVVVQPSAGADNIYRKQVGSFGLVWWHVVQWIGCREVFHRRANKTFRARGFYFVISKNGREDLAQFIKEVEDRLVLSTRTKIHQTNLPDVVYIDPSRFWFRQWMRFSLFTILLRAGMRYKGNIEDTLKASTYSSQTYRAIIRFLEGRTHWTGWGWNWVETFVEIPCAPRERCIHTDRRCRRWLDNMLVPPWQRFGIHYLVRAGKETVRFSKRCCLFAKRCYHRIRG